MKKLTTLLPALVSLAAASVLAEENALETVLVTAARSPINLAEVTGSVTVIDRALIEQRQSVFVLDLLRDVPGLQIARTGGVGAQTQLRMRGAEANQVLVLVDGIEALDPTIGDEFQWEHLTSADVERIEVLRGPQSALWGGEALAGVINIVTRRGDDKLRSDLFAEAGSFGTTNIGGRISGGNETVSASASISHVDTDGTNVSRNGGEDDGYSNTTVGLNADWRVSDTLTLGWTGRHTDSQTRTDATDFVLGIPVDPAPGQGDQRGEDASQWYTGLTAKLSTLEGRWEHDLRVNLTSSDRDTISDGGAVSANAQGETEAVRYVSSFGLNGTVSAGGPLLNVAVDWRRDDFDYRCFDVGGVSCTAFGDPNQQRDMTNTGYVLELLSGDLGAFSGSASLRHDRNDEFEDQTTYRLSGAYQLTDSARIRTAYGTGWKAPTFTERFGFFPGQFVGNEALEPETSKSFEVGLDLNLADDKVTLSATYFDEYLDNEINGFAFDPALGSFTAVNLTGLSDREGLELSLVTAVSDNLDITANYTYLDATDPDGNDEVRRPRHTSALNANYRLPEYGANLNLNISWVGDRDDLSFATFPATTEILGDYFLANLTASMPITDSFEVYGRIDNLLDEDYEDVFGFATPGLSATAGFRLRLGL